MPDFECRLKKYRLLKDLTQEQLAAQVGVRRETIMRLEKARYEGDYTRLKQKHAERRARHMAG